MRDQRTSNRLAVVLLLSLVAGATGCTGTGGAVSVRWRISELGTGKLYDPRDISDSDGACCKDPSAGPCVTQPGWRITRVQLRLLDQATDEPLVDAPNGLDSPCSARELTTPFELPPGTYAISLRAYDPTTPDVIEAESPSPEIRTLRRSEIVNLDVVELSVVP